MSDGALKLCDVGSNSFIATDLVLQKLGMSVDDRQRIVKFMGELTDFYHHNPHLMNRC